MSDRAYKQGGHVWFHCPGCECAHRVRVEIPVDPHYVDSGHWTWNGRLDLPTFAPSVRTWSGTVDGVDQRVCHSYVLDGQIQFLGDCWHALAGQTVDLPAWEPGTL